VCSLADAANSDRAVQIKGTLCMIAPSGRETKWTDFSVSLSGSKYRIANLFFNGELLMTGSDGTNAYFLNKMATAPPDRHLEFGRVTAGRFPEKDLTPGQLCWLAFAASDSFRTSCPAVLPLEGFQENANDLRCNVTLSAKRPFLPRSAKWYGSDHWHYASGNTRLPYPSGFLAGEYLVTSTTNFESFEFPLGFELKFYLPAFTGTAHLKDDVALGQTLRGHVITIERIGRIDDFRPELGPRAQIVDFRLPAVTDGDFMRAQIEVLAGTDRDLLIIDRLNRRWPEPGEANLAVAGIQEVEKHTTEQDGPANRSQPSSSQTNGTSGAAGSGR
jgi:hypothetical protein